MRLGLGLSAPSVPLSIHFVIARRECQLPRESENLGCGGAARDTLGLLIVGACGDGGGGGGGEAGPRGGI